MDITTFVAGNRDQAFLVGDYNSYRTRLTRQLLLLRKKLGLTTAKNAKYSEKAPVTVEDIAGNNAFVRLLLIQAERAWAQAMHMKSTHVEDNTSAGLVGSTRRHIISRLHKARSLAEILVALLQDRAGTGSSDIDLLEAQAYAQCLAGAEEFEKQSGPRKEDPRAAWKACLESFSQAHVIYSTLFFSTQKDVYKEVLAGTVDPSIRYAAYQSRLSRTITISTVAKQNFPQDKGDLLSVVEKLNPTAFEDDKSITSASKEGTGSSVTSVPTSINWRGRTAPIADASVGQALGATVSAAAELSALILRRKDAQSHADAAKATAAAYDPVLTAAQDTVDAVRRALTDMLKEGVSESDPRVQDLRVSDLAANHALVSWRIGRNRILISSPGTLDDGTMFAPVAPHRHFRKKRRGKAVRGDDFHDASEAHPEDDAKPTLTRATVRIESKPHRLARLTDRVVLYDATIQSIDSIKELRGAARDATFIAELDAQRAYFQSLRCLNIGYAHAILGNNKEALALFIRASDTAETASAVLSQPATATETDAPTLSVTATQVSALRAHLSLQTTRQHGLVRLHDAVAAETAAAAAATPYLLPLSARLHEYPAHVDLTRLVDFPPRFRPVSVKPIFFDIAWNYIDYPGRDEKSGQDDGVAAAVPQVVQDVVGSTMDVVGKVAASGATVAGVIGGEREKARRKEEEEQGGQKKSRWTGWFGKG